jgi:hypothetical protein
MSAAAPQIPVAVIIDCPLIIVAVVRSAFYWQLLCY